MPSRTPSEARRVAEINQAYAGSLWRDCDGCGGSGVRAAYRSDREIICPDCDGEGGWEETQEEGEAA